MEKQSATENVARKRVRKSLRALYENFSPALRRSLLAGLVLGVLIGAVQYIMLVSNYGFFPALIGGLALFAAAVIASALLTLLLAALKRLRLSASLVFFLSLFLWLTATMLEMLLLPLLVFVLAGVYLAYMCVSGRYKALSKRKRILRYGFLGLFGALSVAIVALIIWPGPVLNERPKKAALALPYDAEPQNGAQVFDDPSAPGSHAYTLHYYAASGQKLYPYPGETSIPSRTVDASEMVDGWNGVREAMLGFGPHALPLNARVWLPEGEAPFPLALIVHGNHDAASRSDGGYAYLGELLASRGIIAVSADENFLNSSAIYDLLIFASLKDENDARAYVLLEHLRQLYEWNADANSPFFGKVDFSNIALIGHSRGGEAAALAAAFAQLKVYPDNGLVAFDYPFRIKSVAAIAPVHRQYDPAGLEVMLEDVNYLTIHGAQDMDVSSFHGSDTYRVAGGGVKAKVWMQYANHGQFNSGWGKNDALGLSNLMYNRELLMPMEEQQKAAKVFISAFLESTLRGREEYNALFRDFAYGGDYLPPALYVTDYSDSSMALLDSFDAGYDLNASASGKAAYSASGFDSWTKYFLPGKTEKSNRILKLTWGSDEHAYKYGVQTPVFKAEFAPGAVAAGDKLYISLCSGKESAEEPDVSFRIKLTDSAGNAAEMNINDFGGVVNPIAAPIVKPVISAITGVGDREPVLQMVCIPTESFGGLTGDIVSMEWIMDTAVISKAGQVLYADDLRVVSYAP